MEVIMIVKRFYSFVVLIFLFLFHTIYTIQHPIKGVIAADCHGVIVKSKKWKRKRDIALFVWNHLYDVPMLAETVVKIIGKRLRNERLTVAGMLKEFPELEKYRAEIYNFITLEDPVEKIIHVLKELKKQGFVIILSSNIAPDTFVHNMNMRPDLLDFFDFHFIVKDEDAQQEAYLKKEDPRYFVQLRKTVNEYAGITDDVEILFVDDQKENVEAALQSCLNIRGIYPEELENIVNGNLL